MCTTDGTATITLAGDGGDTYPAIVGLKKSRKIAEQLTNRAFAALKPFGKKAAALEALAEYLLKRDR